MTPSTRPQDIAEVPADVLVVGSGVAGLTAALDAAEAGLRVLVVTRGQIGAGSTAWAQGGLAAVTAHQPVPGDDLALHARDTLVAGAGLCDADAVSSVLAEAGAAVGDLLRRGAVFDTAADGSWLRTREGGHSAARVIRAGGDATGAEVSRALVQQARARAMVVLEGHRVVTVLRDADGRVAGVEALAEAASARSLVLPAHAVVLATGGVGQLYARSTNPPGASGDGIALALRAGAQVSDLEFVQFHPTALAVAPDAGGNVPLVTEAVRGEGGVLRDAAGRPLLAGVHPDRDLAPRDVVALAIARYLQASGEPHVWLDTRAIPGFAARFPTVAGACREAGVDPAERIPVAPAAHYHCGGVLTDLAGRTTVPGLYAAGEVARTGLHGANRLASNSLVEGLVMGRRCAADLARVAATTPAGGSRADARVTRAAADGLHCAQHAAPTPGRTAGPHLPRAAADPPEVPGLPAVQAAMSAHAGIARDESGLARAVGLLLRPAPATPAPEQLTVLAAAAIVVAAREREESRGCHQRTDRPGSEPELQVSTRWCLADPSRDESLRRCRGAVPAPTASATPPR